MLIGGVVGSGIGKGFEDAGGIVGAFRRCKSVKDRDLEAVVRGAGREDKWKAEKRGEKYEIMSTFIYNVRAVRRVRRFFCLHFWNGHYSMQFLNAISRFLNI